MYVNVPYRQYPKISLKTIGNCQLTQIELVNAIKLVVYARGHCHYVVM